MGGGEKTPVGRVVSFDEDVEAVTSNFVARIRPHESVWNRFFLYLLSAHYMSGYSHQFIKQNTGIQNLDDTNLFRSDVWVPDLATQRQIADFLDRETARIDLLIEKKQRLVALLEEKSASEVDYLIDGTHPRFAHVNSEYSERRALKLKTLCSRLGNGFVGPTRDILVEEEYSNSVPYLQSTHVKNRQIEFERKPYFVTNAWLKEKPKARVRRDDLVIVQTGAGCGATAIVDDKFDGSGCHAMIITRPKPERILPRLLLQILCSRSGREALASIETGALHPHLEVGFVKEVSIPTPPPSVQRNLLNWIEDELAALERIQQKTIASIDRLREYRSAQITAAVTGQIDVSTYAKSGTPTAASTPFKRRWARDRHHRRPQSVHPRPAQRQLRSGPAQDRFQSAGASVCLDDTRTPPRNRRRTRPQRPRESVDRQHVCPTFALRHGGGREEGLERVCLAGQRPRSSAQGTRRGKQQSQGLRRVPNQTDHTPGRSDYRRRSGDHGTHVHMSIRTEAPGVCTSQYGKCFENNKSFFIKELKA
ncbi:restriction endonuclease subunit S [Seohaeicola zhoushanensis]